METINQTVEAETNRKVAEAKQKPAKASLKQKEGLESQRAKGVIKKLDPDTARLLSQLKERANKKAFGRKVREADIFSLSLKLVTAEHIQVLQEATYSEKDRLEMVHNDYQKKHGKLSLDAFIGKLMRGEINLKELNQ